MVVSFYSSDKMDETQLAADFDLINSLKLETDALLSETRSKRTFIQLPSS